jgi:hypothetical protein
MPDSNLPQEHINDHPPSQDGSPSPAPGPPPLYDPHNQSADGYRYPVYPHGYAPEYAAQSVNVYPSSTSHHRSQPEVQSQPVYIPMPSPPNPFVPMPPPPHLERPRVSPSAYYPFAVPPPVYP